jgi:hypothetical protein
MDIKKCGSQPSAKAPAEYFTGAVRIDRLFQATAPARARGAIVTFEPGARSAWHSHPLEREGDSVCRSLRLHELWNKGDLGISGDLAFRFFFLFSAELHERVVGRSI